MKRVAIVGLAVVSLLTPAAGADPSPAEVFERRIVPIFKSPDPSSCVRCHLAGVDLKDYILPDAARTFRSLRDQGLIDLDAPEKSKIVALIDMGGDPTAANAVDGKLRRAEREAFLAWIAACAADPALRASPKLAVTELGEPDTPDEVIRHARKDRVAESFERNVWAWRFRCMNCHTEGTPQNDKSVGVYGDRVAWVKKGGAGATMDYLIASKLIDPMHPNQSLLLRKPLGDKHEGGVKFAVGAAAYKGFRAWIEDVAAIQRGAYRAANNLPRPDAGPARFGTDIWLKLEDCPPAWGDKLLEVRLFAWDSKAAGWERDPVAVSDRVVFGKGRLWQHNLTLLAAAGSDRAKAWRTGTPTLPAGKYLARAYLDAEGRLASDWKAELGDANFAGQVGVESRWPAGYGKMTAVPWAGGPK